MDVGSALSTSVSAGTSLVQSVRGRYSLSGGEVPASYDEVNRASVDAVLHLVARGFALVAALQHAAQRAPHAVFTPDKSNRFTPLLADFSYLKDPTPLNAKLEGNAQVEALDQECKKAYSQTLKECYNVFEGITQYHSDLLLLMQQLGDGVFLHASLETLLMGHEGRQLTVECVSLLGILMLMLERLIPGVVRERMIVAHLRYQGGPQAIGRSLNPVITLCASTGLHMDQGSSGGVSGAPAGARYPTGYPERYLARLPVPPEVTGLLITCLKSDDLYSQIGHYPNPNHRSVALAQQAGYLYALLFMRSDALHRDLPLMRMLVDKHFSDNWVVPWAPGLYADLAVEWDNYKAARLALSAVITTPRAKQLATSVTQQLPVLRKQLKVLMDEGVLDAEYLLRNATAVFGLLRTCNVALRWTLLQAATHNRKLREAVISAAPEEHVVVQFLVDTALAEFQIKKLYTQLLATRQRRWNHYKDLVQQQLRELTRFYSGSLLLSRSLIDEPLSEWFAGCAVRVGRLTGSPPAADAMELRRLIAALDEVSGYHKVESSLQAKESLSTIRGALETLCCLAAVREEMAASLAAMADFSYAWGIIHRLIPAFKAHLRAHPSSVYGMRCVLIKCRSVMELPLLRLSHAGSKHMGPASQHFSRQLLQVIHEVMQVVPVCVLELLEDMATLFADKLRPLPSHVPRDQLRDLAALPERAHMAVLQERVANYAQGILATDRSFVGVLEWHPHAMFVEGLRKQLHENLLEQLKKLTTTSRSSSAGLLTFWMGTPDTPLAFTPGNLCQATARGTISQGVHELSASLRCVLLHLRSMQLALVGGQDKMQINAMQLWRQEFAGLIREQLSTELQRLRSYGLKDMDAALPEAALHLEHKGLPVTFLGQLACELLRCSDPSCTIFRCEGPLWEDGQGNTLLALPLWRNLSEVLSSEGLMALDTLLAWRMTQALKWVFHECANVKGDKQEGSAPFRACRDLLDATGGPPCCHYPRTGLEAYSHASAASSKFCEAVAYNVAAIGQIVLLRRAVRVQLRLAADCQGSLAATLLTKALHTSLCKESSQGPTTSAASSTTQQQQGHDQPQNGAHDGAAGAGDGSGNSLNEWHVINDEGQHESDDSPSARTAGNPTEHFAAWVHAYGLEDPIIAPEAQGPLDGGPHFAILLFLVLLYLAPRYQYCSVTSNNLFPRERGGLDAAAVSAGLVALLRCAQAGTLEALCAYVGQAIRTLLQACSIINSSQSGGGTMDKAYRKQTAVLFALMEQVVEEVPCGAAVVQSYIPSALQGSWRKLMA